MPVNFDPGVTEGHLLGGRVSYAQPRRGFRSGLEPVLLAAAVPARPGDRVLEGGTGAGAGLLCLAARVAGITGVGIERVPAMAALAERNLAANGLTGLAIVIADLTTAALSGPFDHVFANPPWHDPGSTGSPEGLRRSAMQATPGLLPAWVGALAAPLRPRGTLTLMLPPAHLPEAFDAVRRAACAPAALFPFWPRQGRPAKLILFHAIKGGRGRCIVHSGLVLHDRADAFTAEAEAILRGAQALRL
ncbi:MAG: tRNA1(Val) (adenine(37)-N6)-methyltransferase [Acetobacteraceae bacterium]